jgi:hypothetical protein
VKSLRKLGVPFEYGEMGNGSRKPVRYSFNHTMELALALTLRVYGRLPDSVLEGLLKSRHELYALYRRPYLEHTTGLGAPVRVAAKGRTGFDLSDVYLDFRIRFSGGRLVGFGPPHLLSPFEALRVYAKRDMPDRAHLPLDLSSLAIELVESARIAPRLRRGPPPRSTVARCTASQSRVDSGRQRTMGHAAGGSFKSGSAGPGRRCASTATILAGWRNRFRQV